MKKLPKIPTIKIEPQPKAKKKAKAKKPAKVARTIGYPPADSIPPDIQDSRPTRTVARAVKEVPVVTPKAPESPAKAVRQVVMTGRIVQGQSCTWLGDLAEAGDDPSNPEKPVCPYCNGGLIHAGDQELARMGNRLYELGSYDSVNPPPRPHPNFVDFVAWMKEQPTCWSSAEEAALDYTQATGKIVDPSR